MAFQVLSEALNGQEQRIEACVNEDATADVCGAKGRATYSLDKLLAMQNVVDKFGHILGFLQQNNNMHSLENKGANDNQSHVFCGA